jgi:predicted nucleotidyltransferase
MREWFDVSRQLCPAEFALYAFGSAARGRTPRDLDLLVVYDKSRLSVTDARSARRQFRDDLRRSLGIHVDVLLMSESEASDNGFVEMEDAILLR